MRREWLIGVGLALGLLMAPTGSQPSPALEQPPEKGFASVAPAPAIQASLQTNLKAVRDWLNDKDYASAMQTAQALVALAQLYGYQSDQASWRDKTTALKDECTRLQVAARNKDAAGCDKAAERCEKLLDELAQNPPNGAKVVDKDFKSFGSTKAWMLLMEWAYVDAKTTKKTKELEYLAYAIADEANVVVHLRSEPRWRQFALETREAALLTAKKAQAKDLDAARAALKETYTRCEACHHGFVKR